MTDFFLLQNPRQIRAATETDFKPVAPTGNDPPQFSINHDGDYLFVIHIEGQVSSQFEATVEVCSDLQENTGSVSKSDLDKNRIRPSKNTRICNPDDNKLPYYSKIRKYFFIFPMEPDIPELSEEKARDFI